MGILNPLLVYLLLFVAAAGGSYLAFVQGRLLNRLPRVQAGSTRYRLTAWRQWINSLGVMGWWRFSVPVSCRWCVRCCLW